MFGPDIPDDTGGKPGGGAEGRGEGSGGERSLEGLVMELLPSALVRVRLEGEHEVVAHLPAAQRSNFVRLRVGDRVLVALSATDRTRGRVLELLKKS
jgi:translation initiation factor IF-1